MFNKYKIRLLNKIIEEKQARIEDWEAAYIEMSKLAFTLEEKLKTIKNNKRASNVPSDAEIESKATIETLYPKACYPNSIIERQCRDKFIEGAKWMRKRL